MTTPTTPPSAPGPGAAPYGAAAGVDAGPAAAPAAAPPPPAGPTDPPAAQWAPPPPHREPSAASRVIAILAIVAGAVILLGTVASAAVSTVFATAAQRDETHVLSPAELAGVDELDLEVGRGSLTVEFAAVREAELTVRGTQSTADWTLRADGGTLQVVSPREWFGPMLWGGSAGDARLTLPADLQDGDLSALVELSAGQLDMDGEFARLDLEVSAGRLTVAGAADEVTADMSAGSATLDLAGVDTADLSVSAGGMVADLTGPQPDSILVDISAGSVDLTVPRGDYRITSDVSAGAFDDRIGSTSASDSTVDVTVSAGRVVLQEG